MQGRAEERPGLIFDLTWWRPSTQSLVRQWEKRRAFAAMFQFLCSECPLFPKADVQINENRAKLRSGFGSEGVIRVNGSMPVKAYFLCAESSDQ